MDYYAQAVPYAPLAKNQRSDNRASDQDDVVVLKEKVMIPTEKYPGHNFVGSILGPGGVILKELQKAVNAKIAIFGKGSMRKDKEDEALKSDDEKYTHLKEPLHVLIDIKAPRADAHLRMHHALLEVYKFMTPDKPEEQYDQGPYGPPGFDGGFHGGFGGGFGGPPRGRGAPRGGPRGRGGRGAPRGRGGY